MANVTKIKFQYFKQLEKGTTEHTTGGEREAGPGGHGLAGHRRRGPRGPGAGGLGGGKGRVLAGGAPHPPPSRLPRPAATPRLPGRPAPGRAAPGGPQSQGPPVPAVPRLRQASKFWRCRCVPSAHRDPTRRQRLPRERPSAPGARGKSPRAPMSERLPHDGHARGRGFPSLLPSSGNPL